MPPNRRRTDATAPTEAWQLLGKLLEQRRKELGHTYTTTFFEETKINRRMQADIEKAAKDRINHFMPGTLHILALGYRVTEESMRAVLRGEADELVPAEVAGPRALPPPPPDAPAAGARSWPPDQIAADRPFFDEINERRVELASRGIAYPTGAEMFGDGTEDAKTWDEEGRRLPVGDRVWFIADLRRRASGRDASPQANDRGA